MKCKREAYEDYQQTLKNIAKKYSEKDVASKSASATDDFLSALEKCSAKETPSEVDNSGGGEKSGQEAEFGMWEVDNENTSLDREYLPLQNEHAVLQGEIQKQRAHA